MTDLFGSVAVTLVCEACPAWPRAFGRSGIKNSRALEAVRPGGIDLRDLRELWSVKANGQQVTDRLTRIVEVGNVDDLSVL